MAKANTQTKAPKATEVVAPVEVKESKKSKKVEQVVEAAPAPAPAPAPVEVKETKKGGKKAVEKVEPVVEAAPAPVEVKDTKKGGKKAVEKVEPVVEVAAPVVEVKASKKGGSKKEAVAPVVEAPVKETKKGGKKSATKDVKPKKEVDDLKVVHRYFRCVYKSTDGQIVHAGRYSGKKPKQAACKALTGIVKSNSLETGEQVTFLIQECTRGSKKKKYSYVGSQVDLEEPVRIKITKKDGSSSEIEYTKNNEVKKISLSECGDLMNVDLPEDREEEVRLQRVEKKAKQTKAKPSAKSASKGKAKPAAKAVAPTKAKAKKA